MNHEELIKKAIKEEMNDIIESVAQTGQMIKTSQSYCNSIALWRDDDGKVIFTINGYIETTIEEPHCCVHSGSNSILIYPTKTSDTTIRVPVEQVEKWIDEITEN